MDSQDLLIREATERDAESIRGLFLAAYGTNYAFPQFFEIDFLKKQIYSDDCLLLVAEDVQSGQVLGTASVVFDVGAYTDLVGEFGRLVVHPDGRGRGIANLLMDERLDRVAEHLHVGLADRSIPIRKKFHRVTGLLRWVTSRSTMASRSHCSLATSMIR